VRSVVSLASLDVASQALPPPASQRGRDGSR